MLQYNCHMTSLLLVTAKLLSYLTLVNKYTFPILTVNGP